MVKIHLFPALEGDCICVTYGEKEYHHILIDGGPPRCGAQYGNIIRKIYEQGEIIEALILTHIDQDHIGGALGGLAETDPSILQKTIKKIYFNTYEGILSRLNIKKNENIPWEDKIMIPVPQKGYGVRDAMTLIDLLKEKGLTEKIHTCIVSGDVIRLSNGVSLRIISPEEKQLRKLADKWDVYEKKRDESGYGIHALNTEKNLRDLKRERLGYDTSVNNLSSIAFLFEYKEIRAAFLADAAAAVCVRGLHRQGIHSSWGVDVLKLSHHGSARNTSDCLLRMLPADHYLISTNASGRNVPDKSLIAHLLKMKEMRNMDSLNLWCNYPWWEFAYHEMFFTKQDCADYIDSGKLKYTCLRGKRIPIKEGLYLYG